MAAQSADGGARAVDPLLAQIEHDAAEAARNHLRRVREADDRLIRTQEALASHQAHIAHLRHLSTAHEAVTKDLHAFVRAEISGSSRCWTLLESQVYATAITPGLVPIEGSGLDLSAVNRAIQDIVELRRVIDLPYIPPKAAKQRFVELLAFLESVRHGTSEEVDRLDAQVEHEQDQLSRAQDGCSRERSTLLKQLEEGRARAQQDVFSRQLQAISETSTIAPYGEAAWPEDPDTALSAAENEVEPLLLGGLHASIKTRTVPDDLTWFETDWLRDLRSLGNLLVPWSDDAGKADAESYCEQIVLRALAAFPAGTLRVAFIDPLGLGRSDASFLALGDHNLDLVHRKVRSSRDDIEELLKDMVASIERITQRYLRGTYASIDEYNTAAEEIAEPYRLLVIHDYPQQFEKGTSLHLLQRVLENGPRCGIHTVIVADSRQTSEYEAGFEDVRVGETLDLGNSTPWTTVPNPGTSHRTVLSDVRKQIGEKGAQRVTSELVDMVGRAAQESGVTTGIDRALRLYEKAALGGSRREIPEDAVPSLLEDPATWWRNSSEHSAVAPIGPSSAREAAVLGFDSESTSSALLIGRPGSGKSTLLHTWISTLTMLYSPQEIELLLVDFKEGVEFAAYAREGLPHASCIAIESEREFGLSVLQETESRIRQRSIDFKRVGGATGLEAYRRASGKTVPRVILVFDEFQVLFSQDDRIGLEAGRLLEKIIRQGRGFGIHVLLGSQSLSGMIALNRQAMQMVSTRILLQSSADDASLALGENTNAHKMLTARGEGVMTNDPNNPEAIIPFRAAYEPDADRETRLCVLRERADVSGFTRRPLVFSSERVVSRDELRTAMDSSGWNPDQHPVLTPGASVSLAPPPSIELEREPGRNLLAVLRDGDEGDAAFTSGVVEDVLLSSPRTEVMIFPLVESRGFEDYLETLADIDRVRLMSRRALASTLGDVMQIVQSRQEEGNADEDPSLVLLLHGVHRARDLDPSADHGFSFDAPAEGDSLRTLEKILAQGPEVGIHVIAWADSFAGITRRLSRQAITDFDLRLAGAISTADAGDFLEPGIVPPARARHAVILDRDSGRSEKVQLAEQSSLDTWRDLVRETIMPVDNAGEQR